MAAIYPVSSSRVSDVLLRNRLMTQFDHDRLELLKLQDQLSTGLRISKPSDDAPAAMRAIGVQRLIEQNERVQMNLSTGSSYVSAADNALQGVSERLANLRAEALGVVDSTSSPTQRAVMAQELQTAIDELTDTGNHRFRGRYLFAGSTSGVQPFSRQDAHVLYHGNQHSLQSFVDNDFLSPTNVNGDQVFGAISPSVAGSVDLNPLLTLDTRLSELHGGAGMTKGSFLVSDGNTTVTIDTSGAETIRDVVRLIETNPPDGRAVVVRLSGNGLFIDLDEAGGGNLTVRDIPAGTTAVELGIREEIGTATAPLVGLDLDPALTLTTPLRNLLGSRAGAVLESAGEFNDIYIEADVNGADWNGVTVQFTAGLAAGDQAIVDYDEGTQTLNIDVSPGTTTAATVVAAVNETSEFNARFDEKLDPNNDGAGVVDFSATAVTSGGSGERLDLESGLQITNGDHTHTVTFEEAETVEDLLNILNGSPANVLARINSSQTGIDIQSRISGTDFSIGENGGTTATQLGVRTLTEDSLLSALNFGQGTDIVAGTDFTIRRKDGTVLEVDLSDSKTIDDVLDRINNHADNTGNAIVARLVETGNGIEIYDENAAGTDSLTIERALSFAVWGLGLVARGEDSASAAVAEPASASVSFPSPNQLNTAFALTANQTGLSLNDVAIEFVDSRVGNVADATYDVANRKLTVNIDASLTQTNQIVSAISAEGTFTAALDTTLDPSNDGTGAVATTGLVGTTSGGAAEALRGSDVNPQETKGLFNTLLKLSQAVEAFDLPQIQRTVAMLDEDYERMNFARAELGARGRAFDALERRVEDEQVELKATLSQEIDADIVKAISDLTARQASMQATLQLVGRLVQNSILDFL